MKNSSLGHWTVHSVNFPEKQRLLCNLLERFRKNCSDAQTNGLSQGRWYSISNLGKIVIWTLRRTHLFVPLLEVSTELVMIRKPLSPSTFSYAQQPMLVWVENTTLFSFRVRVSGDGGENPIFGNPPVHPSIFIIPSSTVWHEPGNERILLLKLKCPALCPPFFHARADPPSLSVLVVLV